MQWFKSAVISTHNFFFYANRKRGSQSSDAPFRLVEVTANWTHTSPDCGETGGRNVSGWVTWWQTKKKNPLQVWDGVVTHSTMSYLFIYFIFFGWLINVTFLPSVGSWGHWRIGRSSDSQWNKFKQVKTFESTSNQYQTSIKLVEALFKPR